MFFKIGIDYLESNTGVKRVKKERNCCGCCANQDVSYLSSLVDVSLSTFAAAAKENPRLRASAEMESLSVIQTYVLRFISPFFSHLGF